MLRKVKINDLNIISKLFLKKILQFKKQKKLTYGPAFIFQNRIVLFSWSIRSILFSWRSR